MLNERGAGRKSIISESQLIDIKKRIDGGEKVSALAKEYGLSRQALYKKLRVEDKKQPHTIRLDYYINDICNTRIDVDIANQNIAICNYTIKLSRCAFGANNNPSWQDFTEFLEKEYLYAKSGVDISDYHGESEQAFMAKEDIKNKVTIADALSDRLRINPENTMLEDLSVPCFNLSKKEMLFYRSDTDGFQIKGITNNRKWFIKAQANISGVLMHDYAVEVLASDICKQLSIPCVEQRACKLIYGGRTYKAVYSKNFEMDGYTFISFERMMAGIGVSTNDYEFIHLNAIDKLNWCAGKLAVAGKLRYKDTLKYMLDLAVVDCLVGNVDRHTRNFGLFFNIETNRYEIPLIFDNGMGMFEHDNYRDQYKTFEDAMMHVYVSPYGEDPFDMITMLDAEYDLRSLYPGIDSLVYNINWDSLYAKEYVKRIRELWQK